MRSGCHRCRELRSSAECSFRNSKHWPWVGTEAPSPERRYTYKKFSYLGKSTGAGALSVWTHYLKDIEFLHWSDQNHKGKAIKMGAGVQAYEAMAAARAQDLVVVGGECSTVGVAGGYTQGGGHSALSTSFGLAADQTLEWEVVTASGELVTASRTQNADLYWALRHVFLWNRAVYWQILLTGRILQRRRRRNLWCCHLLDCESSSRCHCEWRVVDLLFFDHNHRHLLRCGRSLPFSLASHGGCRCNGCLLFQQRLLRDQPNHCLRQNRSWTESRHEPLSRSSGNTEHNFYPHLLSVRNIRGSCK